MSLRLFVCSRPLFAPFYAVAHGRETGIFSSWDVCRASVNGYNGCLFRKFDSKSAAANWLYERSKMHATDRVSASLPAQPVIPKPIAKSAAKNVLEPSKDSLASKDAASYCRKAGLRWPPLTAFTDGACSNQQDAASRHCGVGVYWGDGHPGNLSLPLPATNMSELSMEASVRSLGVFPPVIDTDATSSVRAEIAAAVLATAMATREGDCFNLVNPGEPPVKGQPTPPDVAVMVQQTAPRPFVLVTDSQFVAYCAAGIYKTNRHRDLWGCFRTLLATRIERIKAVQEAIAKPEMPETEGKAKAEKVPRTEKARKALEARQERKEKKEKKEKKREEKKKVELLEADLDAMRTVTSLGIPLMDLVGPIENNEVVPQKVLVAGPEHTAPVSAVLFRLPGAAMSVVWVRGHAGIPGNVAADHFATAAARDAFLLTNPTNRAAPQVKAMKVTRAEMAPSAIEKLRQQLRTEARRLRRLYWVQ
eukprot:TRINITY_DN2484_c0_g1_i2.p1 TRINITY_DN2484_c0_g1~~TRINITY_DN2484_c0_g1_i2.p1  ORF type:complete len:477 (+),score=65.06 TRINITY_DN2484_c0_g1_i2:33-1463(+)